MTAALFQITLTDVDIGTRLGIGGDFFTITSIGDLVGSLLFAALVIATIAFLFYFLWGSIRWLSAGGDKAKIEDAKQRITHSFIGLALLAGAWAFYGLVVYALGLPIVFENGSSNGGIGPSGGNGGGGTPSVTVCTCTLTVNPQSASANVGSSTGFSVTPNCSGGASVSTASWSSSSGVATFGSSFGNSVTATCNTSGTTNVTASAQILNCSSGGLASGSGSLTCSGLPTTPPVPTTPPPPTPTNLPPPPPTPTSLPPTPTIPIPTSEPTPTPIPCTGNGQCVTPGGSCCGGFSYLDTTCNLSGVRCGIQPTPTPAPFCNDTDGGINVLLRGTVTSTECGSPQTDYCSGSILQEQFCGPNAECFTSSIPCVGGCSNGVCLPTPTPTPIPARVELVWNIVSGQSCQDLCISNVGIPCVSVGTNFGVADDFTKRGQNAAAFCQNFSSSCSDVIFDQQPGISNTCFAIFGQTETFFTQCRCQI